MFTTSQFFRFWDRWKPISRRRHHNTPRCELPTPSWRKRRWLQRQRPIKPRSFTKTLKPPTKFSWQTTLAKAEARLVELQAQPTARPDLSLFLTKALDSAKPDYTGLASLLTAARPSAQEVTRAGSASAEPTYSVSQLMEMITLFKQWRATDS